MPAYRRSRGNARRRNIHSGTRFPSRRFAPLHSRSQVLRDEAFTFQLAVIPGAQPLNDLSVTFEGFPESWTESLTCLNCGGIDENGFPFTKDLHVSAATLQPLWIGVRIPENQTSGPR